MPPKTAPKRSSLSIEDAENYDPQQPPTKKARTTKPKPKKSVGTSSLNKKEIGDKVKHALRLEKYHISKMHFEMQMDTEFFRDFFVDNDKLAKPLQVTPSDFDETTPVVVIEMNNAQAGDLLGVSKVTGGNRMASTHVHSLCVIFRPADAKTTIYISPEESW